MPQMPRRRTIASDADHFGVRRDQRRGKELRRYAWQEGKRLLETAIRERTNHAPREGACRGPRTQYPRAKIRERWDTSRLNLIMPMPQVTELRLFDNSEERDSVTGKIPPPKLLLHWKGGAVVGPPSSKLEATPEWAQPIVAYALQLQRAAAARRPGC